MTATDDGKRERMHIGELDTSHQEETPLSASRSTDTRVLERINKM